MKPTLFRISSGTFSVIEMATKLSPTSEDGAYM